MLSSNRGCGQFQFPSAKGRVEFGCVLGCIFPLVFRPALDESYSHAEESVYQWRHLHIYSCGSDPVKVSFRNMFTLQ